MLLTAGNCLCNGSQQDKAITPANGFGNNRAEYNAKAPPCENPPTTIRFEAIPHLISCSIIEWTSSVARRIPSSSSGPLASNVLRSNLKNK